MIANWTSIFLNHEDMNQFLQLSPGEFTSDLNVKKKELFEQT
jgi:hypothetical protein